MRRLHALPVLLLVAILGAPPVYAHEVKTKDGKVLEGKILSETDDEVVIETTFDGVVTVPAARVAEVDRTSVPLREQLQFRADLAKDDVGQLWDLHKWAKRKGFGEELGFVLDRILQLEPNNARAHKMLGHERVDGVWMTPEEKAQAEARAHEEAMRAQGLVPYEGEWVTPEEKDARERGLIRDGDEWVTEEEYHRRRGEELVDGRWVKVGEEEGKAYVAEIVSARVPLKYTWSTVVDIFADVKPEDVQRISEGADAVMRAMRSVLRPGESDFPTGLRGRIKLFAIAKLPTYARLAKWFDEKHKASELVPGWDTAVQRQHSWWWVDPDAAAAYKFPNTSRTFVSNVLHGLGHVLLTRYKFNYEFPSLWLREGFAYHMEMESIGYSETFSLSRGGSAQGTEAPVWSDSDKWRDALKALVAEGGDPPLRRMAKMEHGQMGYHELVKAWSLVESLIRWDPVKFKTFVDLSKKRDMDEEDALREAFGVDYRQLDVKWRAYVSGGFQHS